MNCIPSFILNSGVISARHERVHARETHGLGQLFNATKSLDPGMTAYQSTNNGGQQRSTERIVPSYENCSVTMIY